MFESGERNLPEQTVEYAARGTGETAKLKSVNAAKASALSWQ